MIGTIKNVRQNSVNVYEMTNEGNLYAGGIQMEQSLTIEAFNEKLQAWNGQTIKITKKELHDLDETILSLKSVSYSNHNRRLDDYVPEHSLLLHGDGEIENEANSMEPLPAPVYEIPLTEESNYHANGNHLSVITDRAEYTLELQS